MNSEIFTSFFSKLRISKVRENKSSRNDEITLSFTVVANHALVAIFLRHKYVF